MPKSIPKITIAVQCHNFQKRLCWMLSSLIQQDQPEDLAVNIAYVTGNGTPKTCEVIETIRGVSKHMSISENVYSDISEFQYRGLVRNRQLERCDTEWLLFADCDMVYHPNFFRKLRTLLNSESPYYNSDAILTAGRLSNTIEITNNLIDSFKYPAIMNKAWNQADTQLDKIRRGNVGAGFFQLINVNHVEHDGYYVDPKSNRDYSWDTRFQKAKSDQQFRKRIGKTIKLPDWFTLNQIHLNHNRDNMFGKHLEEQR